MTKNTLNFIYGFILLVVGVYLYHDINIEDNYNAIEKIKDAIKWIACFYFSILGLTRMNESTN